MMRSLLSIFPAASALLGFRANGAPVPQPAFTEAGFSICVQCWSLKEFALFEAIEMAAATGAGGIEVYPGQRLGGDHGKATFGPDMTDDQVQAVIGQLEKHHIAAVNCGVIDIPKDEAGARRIFEFARKFNLYGITTESLGSIDILEKLAAEYDLKVCFHNHPRPTALWHPDTIWKTLENRHENLGFCADVGHWAASGLDPLTVVRKVASRIHAFHMKDRTSTQEPSRDQPFGTGIIDIASILDEVRKHGFAGNVSIEYEYNWTTNLPEIAQCVGYLRAYSKLR
ncbi:MAG: sugar phosphate isomerase/epimerase family protein [Luteolibacter sp.]|uniref:sugar phosphate isomerase/epimerase family protein n=1 Tax=Luteolibacter sp. TaxID=1962973 RepID=UPI003262DAB6